TAHLILCDGATLAVTNANGRAIQAYDDLTIYGQTNGSGAVTANGIQYGIYADRGSVTINGGTVTAESGPGGGGCGIYANNGSIILGWTNPTDSITASSYYAGEGSVRVKTDQRLTDGSAIYTDYLGTHPTTLKGKTLRPAYSITLPEGVVAGGVVRQDGTTAYAIAGTNVTLNAATPGYAIGTVTVNGVPLEPVAGTYSFTASADVTIAATVTPVTYIVRFDAGADGVTGSMPDQSFTYGVSQPLTANAFTRAGYTFAGWLRADGAIYPDGADVDRLYVRYIVRYADNKEDTWKRFDRMPYPGKANDDYHIGDGALQNTENENGLNLYTGFENSAWDPTNPALAELISQNAGWFDEHDARYGVSMKLIEDFPNFYKEPVVVAQDGVVTLTAIWHPPVPYIDADGTERLCTDYTVLTDATDDVMYGEWNATAWYVVTNAVTISGKLFFRDNTAHLILCDGATLTVTNTNHNSEAIGGSGLTIYGQANGTGAVVANGDCGIAGAGSVTINGGNVTAIGRGESIAAGYSLTINGGRVTATGNNGGIFAQKGTITLGWTNPTDSITASSYYAGSGVRVKSGQRLTDGSAIYKDTDYLGPGPSALRGKTLRPYIYTPTYPAYLGLPADPADDTEGDAVIRANYDAWALRYGYDALGAYEAAFLLNVAPWATPIELRIAGIEVVEGGARVRVTCRAGLSAEALAEAGASAEAGAVDLSQINGVISVSAGDDLGALAPKSVSGITYSEGEATIFVPASAGRFVKAVIGRAAPAE
ncbi:MAG: InlB B-repeat-containing protein, partial [Kiritimatiellae bacterium]|nr:InlB B-repeat-containing protein [Kiritimatiellia bacterium]